MLGWVVGGGGWAVGVGRWGLGGWAAGSGADWAGAGLGQPRNGLLGLGAGGPEVGSGGGPGRGRAMGGLGGLGWAAQKRKLVYSKMATLCPDRKYELSNGQQQQAISIYFFLEGLGFGVYCFRGTARKLAGAGLGEHANSRPHRLLASKACALRWPWAWAS